MHEGQTTRRRPACQREEGSGSGRASERRTHPPTQRLGRRRRRQISLGSLFTHFSNFFGPLSWIYPNATLSLSIIQPLRPGIPDAITPNLRRPSLDGSFLDEGMAAWVVWWVQPGTRSLAGCTPSLTPPRSLAVAGPPQHRIERRRGYHSILQQHPKWLRSSVPTASSTCSRTPSRRVSKRTTKTTKRQSADSRVLAVIIDPELFTSNPTCARLM